MKYEGRGVNEYSLEESLEFLKNYYLIRKNNPKIFYDLVSSSSPEIRAEVAKILTEIESFDDIHKSKIDNMVKMRNEIEEDDSHPLAGDFIRLKSGEYLRMTVDLDDNRFQAYQDGSFHCSDYGHFSYSGACGDVFKKSDFKLTKEEKVGSFWFWHTRKGVGGGNGTNAKALFRVFKEITEE